MMYDFINLQQFQDESFKIKGYHGNDSYAAEFVLSLWTLAFTHRGKQRAAEYFTSVCTYRKQNGVFDVRKFPDTRK